jgi:hypothetical protein
MKKFVILATLALELAVCGCGRSTPLNTVTTTTNGNWEAQLIGGTGPSSQLNFVTSFQVTTFSGQASQPLDFTNTSTSSGVGFFNASPCFSAGKNAVNESGNATLNTDSAGQVTGSLNMTITNAYNSNVLTLTTTGTPPGGVSGTSTGTIDTTGTLANGVVWGTWMLTSPDPHCILPNGGTVSGTFLMCQGTTTCTIP